MKLDFLGRDLTSKDLLLLHYIISGKRKKNLQTHQNMIFFLHKQQNCVKKVFQNELDMIEITFVNQKLGFE